MQFIKRFRLVLAEAWLKHLCILLYFIPKSNAGFLSLEIPVASTYDTGEYVVEVRNEEGKIKSSCYLQVERTIF